jgi:phosphate transport system substrate-binding protein
MTMKLVTKNLLQPIFSLTFLVGLSALVSSCQPSQPNKTTTAIKIDGSDTVYPITQESKQ